MYTCIITVFTKGQLGKNHIFFKSDFFWYSDLLHWNWATQHRALNNTYNFNVPCHLAIFCVNDGKTTISKIEQLKTWLSRNMYFVLCGPIGSSWKQWRYILIFLCKECQVKTFSLGSCMYMYMYTQYNHLLSGKTRLTWKTTQLPNRKINSKRTNGPQ